MTPQRPYDVMVVAELNVDLIISGDVVPVFGQVEKIVDDFTICAGSSGGIFAAGCAKMGLSVLLVSVVGADPFGEFMLSCLEEAGVDTANVKIDPTVKTGASVILAQHGDRAILTYLGSIAAVSADLIDAGMLARVRHLHIASPFLMTRLRPALPRLMRDAKSAGVSVSLDTNWDPSGRWEVDDMVRHTDILLPNENELCAIAGEKHVAQALCPMAARVPVIAVKRGARGALGAHGALRERVDAYPVQVVDATGAGDSFDAGFLAGWLDKRPLRECLQLGAACGAMTATTLGGFNGQATWDEAEALVARTL